MNLGLDGKVALVAAASRGLGRAIATELAAEGAAISMCARDAAALERARHDIESKTGRPVLAVTADVSRSDDVVRFVDETLARFGRVDVLVTNAGGPPAGLFEAHDAAAWENAFRLTLASAVELARRVLPGMKERRWGRIINVTSIAAKQPVDYLILSNSLRAAVTGFARTLATEVAPFGITVNNVLPGYTRTERMEALAAARSKGEGISREAAFADWEKQIPARRLGEPDELAALTAFLASERAAYITAQSIAVDGGWIRALY
ncbi:MAG TPA: SDR family oxidoreductase [Gemmatimonadaceae bacterium]|nr:SDR family oxidoreductase [Gemmatimonadaceae bacterium]